MEFERVMEVYSPGMVSPEPVKKPRKNISAPSVSAAGAALQAASKGAVAVKAAKAPSKAAVKKRVVDSDDDEEEGGEDVEVEVVHRTPKPVRQRAIKSYVQEESEEEEEEADESDYGSD